MNAVNHQIRLAARPVGVPTPSDWKLTTEPVPVPGPGEFIVAVAYLSVDPAMLTWINATSSLRRADRDRRGDGHRGSRAGHCLRTILSSEVGDHVYGAFGVQEFARSDGDGVTKLDPLLRAAADLPRGARHHRLDRVLWCARCGPHP